MMIRINQKFYLWILYLSTLSMFLSACREASNGMDTPVVSPTQITTTIPVTITPTGTPTIIDKEEPLPSVDREQIIIQIDDILSGRLKAVNFGFEDRSELITVEWNFEGGGSNRMIASQAREETTDILDILYHSEIDYEQITLSGWYTITVDINNNLEYLELLSLDYSEETLDQINWKTVRPPYIWLVADRAFVHRLLQE